MRPHPFENEDSYEYFLKKYNNNNLLEIDNESSPISDFFDKVDVVVAPNSSVVLESILSGTPVISLHSIIYDRLSDHVGVDHLNLPSNYWAWRPKNIDEAVELIDKAMSNELPLLASNSGYAEYVKERLDLPREKFAILSSAEEVNAIAQQIELKYKKSNLVHFIVTINYRIYLILSILRTYILIALYKIGLYPGNINIIIHEKSLYGVWRQSDKKKTNKYWQKFIKASGLDGKYFE